MLWVNSSCCESLAYTIRHRLTEGSLPLGRAFLPPAPAGMSASEGASSWGALLWERRWTAAAATAAAGAASYAIYCAKFDCEDSSGNRRFLGTDVAGPPFHLPGVARGPSNDAISGAPRGRLTPPAPPSQRVVKKDDSVSSSTFSGSTVALEGDASTAAAGSGSTTFPPPPPLIPSRRCSVDWDDTLAVSLHHLTEVRM